MRKFLLAFLFVSMTMNAQLIGFGTKEYFTASMFVDPLGSIREEGLDFGAELELVSHGGYVKVGTQIFPTLVGGYLDTVGAGGFNLVLEPFEETRFYTGLRLGLIHRGIKRHFDTVVYPLVGWEAGFDTDITDKWFAGMSLITDWREDFKFTGGDPGLQVSGRVRAGFKF